MVLLLFSDAKYPAAVCICSHLGKPENFCLPRWTRLLYIPKALLVLLILTNDLHQWVFSFPANEVWTDKNNSMEFGSFVVFGWEVLCAVAALIIVLLKSRQFQQRRYLPGLVMLCSIVYALIYVSGVKWMQIIAGGITAARCGWSTILHKKRPAAHGCWPGK